MDVFGVDNVKAIDPTLTDLPSLENPNSESMRRVLMRLRGERNCYMKITMAVQRGPNETKTFNFMVEDKGHDTQSYHDALRLIHSKIQSNL